MRQAPDALMLFAAGLGTRMGALSASRPKPLVEVAGRPLLDHALMQADAAGIGRIVINLHYLPEQIRAHLADRSDLLFSDETETVLETGGGLKNALPVLGPGPVFTLNTDAVWTGANPLGELRAAWDPASMDALLLLVPKDSAIGHVGAGDFDLSRHGRLTRGRAFVYTGAQILNPAGLAAIEETAFSLNVLWDRMLAEGRLFGIVHQGHWCDVGRPESIALAETLIREGGNV
ncbi:Bifunctional protein GlmU [Defluviimonas aquaemixtae]|uniref:Bifunctional protein GlmU n=1 Tax=Albidovulum aquaemixtae TaxID=1542388 RepID=A0A2R8BJG3_9RHOB|nr:nucleotidyltransferase family protein [Defluviimonas aquaemixtae]SPH23518.1 Bifunctional protein GlmU [Defluviimonas aquaemixtae]